MTPMLLGRRTLLAAAALPLARAAPFGHLFRLALVPGRDV